MPVRFNDDSQCSGVDLHSVVRCEKPSEEASRLSLKRAREIRSEPADVMVGANGSLVRVG
jgi:hypothetical protein